MREGWSREFDPSDDALLARNSTKCLLVIRQEALETDVGEGVLHAVGDDLEGRGGDISAGEGAVEHVVGVADARGEDFCIESVVVVDLADVADELHAVFADIIETTDEGADEERTRLGHHHRLQGLEAKSHVGLHAFIGQSFAGLQAGKGDREFDDDVVGDFETLAGLFHHAIEINGDDLGADRAGYDLANLGEALAVIDAFLGDECGIGCYTVENAKVGGLFDLIQVGGVDIDFHVRRISAMSSILAGCGN